MIKLKLLLMLIVSLTNELKPCHSLLMSFSFDVILF